MNASNVVTKKTSYYPGGAMRVDIVGGANTLYYMLKDHLGSASVLLDSTGVLVTNGEQRYYPFGESRLTSADLKTDHLFTGQLSMGLGGIYSYGARFYSPRLGRFLSADTIVPEVGDPQALNRFSYVYNNPLRYSDPTGHEACYDTGLEIGSDISQADCWAYGADKWINGLDVAAPVAGGGYNTLQGLIGGELGGAHGTSAGQRPKDDPVISTAIDVINYLMTNSSIGKEIMNLIFGGPGITIQFWDSDDGNNLWGNSVSIPDPNLKSMLQAAEMLAHEAIHVLQRFSNTPYGMGKDLNDTYEAEREAYIVSHAVFAQLTRTDQSGTLNTLIQSYDSSRTWLQDIKGYSILTTAYDKCTGTNCSWDYNLRKLGLSQSAINTIYSTGHLIPEDKRQQR